MTIRRSLRFALLVASLLAVGSRAHADADSPQLGAPPPAPLPAPPLSPPPPEASRPVSANVPAPTSAASVRLTYESTRTDTAAAAPAISLSPDDSTLLHGFRIGYGYVANYDRPVPTFNGTSFKDTVGLRSPHHFLLGYEVMYRVVSHSWLNVLLLANGIIAGLEQSKVLPSANLLIGAELKNTFQIGVGANLSPLKGSEAHTIIAAGWTPRVGTIYTPVHFFFIPDVDGVHRMGVTTGVTF